jgi:lipoprotein-anchoring transpeptidase ErfK/SrfK
LLFAQPVTADVLVPVENGDAEGEEDLISIGHKIWRDPYALPGYVPVSTATRIANIQLPDPLPQLEIMPVTAAQSDTAPSSYAQVLQNEVPVYGHPIEAAYGLPPKRQLGTGFIWVSVQGKTLYEGREYYQINTGEYVPAEALSFYRPSAFQGVALAEHPARPFAWILTPVQPWSTPDGAPNPDAPVYQRYQVVQIFDTQLVGDQVWYLIAEDQWINQIYVGKVTPSAPPPEVGGAAWIDVNLFEQTLAAYAGEQMVYATLISSGLPGWDTPVGLFQVWRKVASGKMSGAYNKPDYYFLEDVPWAMYFNQDVALHGAYWHNSFGYRHSHGCVNLAPADARWLFEWAPEDTWVRVQAGQ